jgi:hypothetical protein
MIRKLRNRSKPMGSFTLEWWNRIEMNSRVCQMESASGDAPVTATCANLQGTDSSISPKWKRNAVDASRSRSIW